MGITSSEYSGGIRTTKYDNSKLLLFDNSFEDGEMNNSTYDDVTHPGGTLVGRVSATGLLVPLESAANDGSQFPVGVLVNDFIVPDGETVPVRIVTGGEIDASKVIFQGSDTVETTVANANGRRLGDLIAAETLGLDLRTVDELSEFDND